MDRTSPRPTMTANRAAPVLYGAIGRVQAATSIVADIMGQLDAARTVGDLVVSDLKREQIRRLVFEFSAKAIEVTAALAELGPLA